MRVIANQTKPFRGSLAFPDAEQCWYLKQLLRLILRRLKQKVVTAASLVPNKILLKNRFFFSGHGVLILQNRVHHYVWLSLQLLKLQKLSLGRLFHLARRRASLAGQERTGHFVRQDRHSAQLGVDLIDDSHTHGHVLVWGLLGHLLGCGSEVRFLFENLREEFLIEVFTERFSHVFILAEFRDNGPVDFALNFWL